MPWDCIVSLIKPDISKASGASSRPITATTAPIAAGGKIISIQAVPNLPTTKDKIIKDKPNAINPPWASP